jgi:phosphoribosylaminoimidazole-succinocarboxamide synthase
MAIKETHFNFPKQKSFYKGKVRDVYTIDDKYIVMIVTDRISAFDVVLPRPIPFKGQILNQISGTFLEITSDIVPNWVIDIPHPNVTIGKLCRPLRVEMVIRGYMAGAAWRAYRQGIRNICGVELPDGLIEHQKLDHPIITPSVKAVTGHDEEISKEEIIRRGIVSEEDYNQIEELTHQLYKRGNQIAAQRGLILVDTKYEFGKIGDTIYLIDEIHTPDSSRYIYAAEYEKRLQRGDPQKQLSKEFVREWLMQHDFQGRDGDVLPEMTDDVVRSISDRYIELYQNIMMEKFVRTPQSDIYDKVEAAIEASLAKLG